MRGNIFSPTQNNTVFRANSRVTTCCAALLVATLLGGCFGNSIDEEVDDDPTKDGETPKTEENTGSTPPIDWSVLTPQPGDITDLILVTGQSNVRGSNTAYDPALDQPNKQAFAFNYDEQWRVADLRYAWDGNWAPGNGSLQDSSRQPHNNFVFHFGKVVAERDSSRVIGYVVISAPGKGIAYWDRDKDFFYEVRDAALKGLNAQGVKSSFDAILWHQGETDWQARGTSDPTISGDERNNPDYYINKLNSLIADFRGQSWVDDNAYFICGETAIAPVNEVLMSLNSDDDPRTGCVAAAGLPTLGIDPVPVHFDAEGLRELGKRYAELYLSMKQ